MNLKKLYVEAVLKWDNIYEVLSKEAIRNVCPSLYKIWTENHKLTYGWYDCGYCQTWLDCKGCPVEDVAGIDECQDTPWEDFRDSPTAENAKKERDFLINNPPYGVEIMSLKKMRKK